MEGLGVVGGAEEDEVGDGLDGLHLDALLHRRLELLQRRRRLLAVPQRRRRRGAAAGGSRTAMMIPTMEPNVNYAKHKTLQPQNEMLDLLNT